MLYSKKIMLDKEYEIKFGIRELLSLKENSLDITKIQEGDLVFIIQLLLVGMKRSAPEMTFDVLVDLIDESIIPFKDITKIVMEAMELGLNKSITPKAEAVDLKSVDFTEESPNV